MSGKPYRIGYTQGVYDMFHVGHLNLLLRAREQCEYLIVGVNSDRLVEEYKHKKPVIPEGDRLRIIGQIRPVDEAVLVDTLDKVSVWKKLHFDAVFIGDDWKGNARWAQTEEDLKAYGAEVIYLPHTPDVSSTGLRTVRDESVREDV